MLAFAILILPLIGSLLCLTLKSTRAILALVVATVLASAAAGALLTTANSQPAWLRLDALTVFHLLLMYLIYSLSSLYAFNYFEADKRRTARRFGALWLAALSAMTLVLVADNIGIMWLGMETTTLLTAFMICLHRGRGALEAMWKYLLICSVGIAFAFLGTLLTSAASSGTLLWSALTTAPLNPQILKTGFVFALVGYGTKAGLAPMHTWLPDAHSQSPAPVSAMFSGFMLNAALYCILRHAAIVNAALGSNHFTATLIGGFGMASLLLGASFIIFQQNLKRLLAYCSVEHMGIICLGIGLGQPAIALLHTLNHSLAKSLGFFAAGRLIKIYDSHEMKNIRGSLQQAPLLGAALTVSLLALSGTAPFAVFLSEFLIIKAAIEAQAPWTLAVLISGTLIAFIAIIKRLINMAWGVAPSQTPVRASTCQKIFYLGMMAALIVLGIWQPQALLSLLEQAALISGGLE